MTIGTMEDDLTTIRRRSGLFAQAKIEGYDDMTEEAMKNLTTDELREEIRSRRGAKQSANADEVANDIETLALVALPVRQLGREAFMTSIKLRDLARLNVDSEVQRKLEKRRLTGDKGLVDYVRADSGYFAPIIVTVTNVAYDGDESTGRLILDEHSDINVNDGQHRVEGYRKAMLDDPDAFSERLDDDVPMLAYLDLSKGEQRQLFADINLHAKKPNRAVSLDYDERNVLAAMTKRLIDSSPAFGWNRVTRAKTKVGAKDNELWTFSTIVDAVEAVFGKDDPTTPANADERLLIAIDFWGRVHEVLGATWATKSTIAHTKVAMAAIGGLYGFVGIDYAKLAEVDWSEGGELDQVAKSAGGTNAAVNAFRKALAVLVCE